VGAARGGTDRARLRQLDLCLTLLEEARERDEHVVSPELSARVRPLVPGVEPGMPIAHALDRVFMAQDGCQPPSQPVPARARTAEPLDARAARALTDAIKAAGSNSSPLLLEAQERRAWVALGYPSWERYVRVELGLSRTRSYELLDHGRLIRAIESATGVSGAAEVTPYAARKLKPYLAELIAGLESRVAGRPAEEIRAIVEDVVRGALLDVADARGGQRRGAADAEPVAGAVPPPPPGRCARQLDRDVFWAVVRQLSSMPPVAEAAGRLAERDADLSRLDEAAAWLADLAAELRARGARY
jgi:hypothetical protein